MVVASVASVQSAGAASATDGLIGSIVPMVSPTAGGGPMRIYGSGFGGTTAVAFGGVPALNFKVIDGTLLTATVPPAANGILANNTWSISRSPTTRRRRSPSAARLSTLVVARRTSDHQVLKGETVRPSRP